MNDHHLTTLAQLRAFLDGTQAVELCLGTIPGHEKRNATILFVALSRFACRRFSKPAKGLLLSCMTHVSGYSQMQVKRLTRTWLKRGQLQPRSSAGNGFTRNYTAADRCLLAELDEPGPATQRLCNVPGGF